MTPAKLKERIEFVHEQVKSDALVEEYIEGRELYVGVIGNERLTRLPVWEMVFGSLPESLASIATRKVKWDKRYQAKYGITTHAAEDLPPAGARLPRPALAPHLSGAGHVRLCSHGLSCRPPKGRCTCSRPMPIRISRPPRTSPSPRAPAACPTRELLERLMDLGLKYRAQWRASYG